MYCPFCGLEIPDHASICTHCGSSINLPAELTEGDIKRIRNRYHQNYGIKTISADEAFKKEIRSEIIPALYSSRVVAFMFDWLIIVGLTVFSMNQFSQIKEFIPFMSIFEAFVYFTFFTAISGRTIGKMIVGIQVVDSDSVKPPTLIQAISRSITCVFSFLFLFAGVIAPFYNYYGKAWHDQLSKTLVIYRR